MTVTGLTAPDGRGSIGRGRLHGCATLKHMRRTSVRDLHIRTSEFVREASEGSVIIIERRGEPVAELRPISERQGIAQKEKAKILSSMKKIWASMPQVADSTKFLEEDRDR